MKKRIACAAFIMISAGVIQGCDTSEIVGTFNASIDGDTWSADAPAATVGNSRITITGIADDQSIMLTTNGIAPGTYQVTVFDSIFQPVVYTPDINVPQTSYKGTAGTIVIEEMEDNRITGTLNVVVSNADTTDNINISGNFVNVIY